MQHDLGLTKSQAEARLAAEKKATAVERKAKHAAGSSYGGSWFDAASGIAGTETTWFDEGLPAPDAVGNLYHPVRHAQLLVAAYAAAAPDVRAGWRRDTLGHCLRLRCEELNAAGEAYLVRLTLVDGDTVAGAVGPLSKNSEGNPDWFSVETWDADLTAPDDATVLVPWAGLEAFEIVLHEPEEIT